MVAPQPHFLVLTFPAQGHINPALQFVNSVLRSSAGGARVTFSTTLFAYKRMLKSPPIHGLFYSPFSEATTTGLRLAETIKTSSSRASTRPAQPMHPTSFEAAAVSKANTPSPASSTPSSSRGPPRPRELPASHRGSCRYSLPPFSPFTTTTSMATVRP